MIYYHLDLYKDFDKKIEKKFNSVNYGRWLLTVGVGIFSSADICKIVMAGKICRQGSQFLLKQKKHWRIADTDTDILNMIKQDSRLYFFVPMMTNIKLHIQPLVKDIV